MCNQILLQAESESNYTVCNEVDLSAGVILEGYWGKGNRTWCHSLEAQKQGSLTHPRVINSFTNHFRINSWVYSAIRSLPFMVRMCIPTFSMPHIHLFPAIDIRRLNMPNSTVSVTNAFHWTTIRWYWLLICHFLPITIVQLLVRQIRFTSNAFSLFIWWL